MADKKASLSPIEEGEPIRSPLDLLKYKVGASHRAKEEGRPPPDSMLAVMQGRATYTFIMKEEVASIHYDRRRGEIFFCGHNIRNMELSKEHLEALMRMEEVLRGDSRGNELFSDYSATLARSLADK